MQRAIQETDRRREKQESYNKTHNIIPIGIKRQISDVMEGARDASSRGGKRNKVAEGKSKYRSNVLNQDDLEKQIISLEKQMFEHAKNLAFEEAAGLRDQIEELRQQFVRS